MLFTFTCGRGEDIDLGSWEPGNGAAADLGGAGLCAGQPCSLYRGTQVFVTASAPADAAAVFAAASVAPPGTDAPHEPAIVYPAHETRFPINVPRILHAWAPGADNAWFELRFHGTRTDVVVFTGDSSYVPSATEWDWIAESNRDGSVVFDVLGVDPKHSERAWRSSPITLTFAAPLDEGPIYYFSTAASGVMAARLSDPIPTKFFDVPANAGSDGTCVGCHSLSRDGSTLSFGLDGTDVGLSSTASPLPIAAPDAGTAGSVSGPGPRGRMMPPKLAAELAAAWSTFSPDGTRVLVASDGALTLLDTATLTTAGPNSGVIQLPDKSFAAHPDWSPDGDRVVFTLADKGTSRDLEHGKIAWLNYDGTGFGPPEVVVDPKPPDDNALSPAFSPDATFIAYVSTHGKSANSAAATLHLLRLSDRKVFDLPRVNARVNDRDGILNIANSMPTWAPASGSSTLWLAFSSVRAYATVREQDKKKDQLWIAGIDPRLADPGFAAFWAPFQRLDSGNHRALFAPGDAAPLCHCVEFCGDEVDNDCDGLVDEPDCVGTCDDHEICGDGIDNDCDCVVDDCSSETCADGVDNDGDGLIDMADPLCARP